MLDVIVTCLPHSDEVTMFPQVRGYYLAKYLAHWGHLRAEFHPLPLPGAECRVLISSEYQAPAAYFEERLEPLLKDVQAERMYCAVTYSLRRDPTHFSRAQCEWFAERGGALVHLPAPEFEPYEHWIGIGVDRDVVGPEPGRERNRILFDFPRSGVEDAASQFDPAFVEAVRGQFPLLVLVGSGPVDSPLRALFDEWVPYGQPHAQYTRRALGGLIAFVPGWEETMGLSTAEAQVAGACIVHSRDQLPDFMLCPEADVRYQAGERDSLVEALAEACSRDATRISVEASVRFDYFAVSRRARRAIGLEPSQEQ